MNTPDPERELKQQEETAMPPVPAVPAARHDSKPGWGFRSARAVLIVLFILLVLAATARFEYAYEPPMRKVLNPDRVNVETVYDVWGKPISREEAERLLQTDEGRWTLSAANGALRIDEAFLREGRRAFYTETFGNEEFATEVLGILDGPLTPWEFAKAIIKLRGRGTDNLRVRIARDANIGGRMFRKGEMIDTGLDVVPGTFAVMGMKIRYDRGRLQSGISCAACHSAVDMHSGKVVEGAPNKNLNIGLLIALAPNSAGFFANTEIPSLSQYTTQRSLLVHTQQGPQPVPDPQQLEEAVDRVFLSWPPGTFDSTTDLVANPSQIPDSFTWRDHPYGWTGFAAAGPFHGLSVLNNNVHAVNSDGLTGAEASEDVFGWDREFTYAMVLQNAVNPKYRWHPEKNPVASTFYASVDPTPRVAGMNKLVHTPTFPKGSLISPDGLFIARAGSKVWFENNAMSAFQNTLHPPDPPMESDAATIARGRQVFSTAGCIDCHSGPAYTNNRVLPLADVRTGPSRAQANRNMWSAMVHPPKTWSWETPVPIPADAVVLTVPVDHLDEEEVRLAYAQDEQWQGGLKVKGLLGLYWSPPYLHNSSIAVGPDAQAQLGVPGTLFQNVNPDPVNSLRALLDRDLRERVVEANRADERLRLVKVEGVGHEHWVDSAAGFSREDQEALIHFLLHLRLDESARPAPVAAAPGR